LYEFANGEDETTTHILFSFIGSLASAEAQHAGSIGGFVLTSTAPL
jgi:hypothetical protein